MPLPLHTARVDSPIGFLTITATEEGITGVRFGGRRGNDGPIPFHLRACIRQLEEYFAGRRRTFDLPLLFTGTAFQKGVWRLLRTVPFGTTLTYGEAAARIGRTGAARALGSAVGKNPLAILVPCHRIIPRTLFRRSSHKGQRGFPVASTSTNNGAGVGGYAWGSWRKEWLLRHETVEKTKMHTKIDI